MKGREAKGAPPADLLVCFPSRAHLTLMPKPLCSPARPAEANKRINHQHHSQSQHQHQHHHHQHHLKKLNIKGAGHASPLMWAKTKPTGPEIAEPTSPKVTCAGQIKVRPKANSCKSWQSVMEEIERIHNNRNKHKNKRPSWAESIGLKKEVMQFLTCLKNIRFDFRCFGAFPRADITTDDEDDEDEDQDHESNHLGVEGSDGNTDQASSRTVFSKWFMVLQENQNNCYYKEEKERSGSVEDSSAAAPAAPPPNALLLMRCRSAPAKSRFQDKAEEKGKEDKEDDDHEEEEEEEEVTQVKKTKNLKSLMEEEKRNNKENLVVMAYDTDFYKISSDVAKETWIVDGMKDLLSRSRSWKR
ncbi:hypothetical protein CUMW_060950 [Citrus unshiu]|uniref:ARID domain-containing protein n=1 Tax=Citrus unshiu TaxID=55188 RepID=A0A2H5NN72_CITUN|nr:hypothetical protein CUMW_060950 [Citrus unshiu]